MFLHSLCRFTPLLPCHASLLPFHSPSCHPARSLRIQFLFLSSSFALLFYSLSNLDPLAEAPYLFCLCLFFSKLAYRIRNNALYNPASCQSYTNIQKSLPLKHNKPSQRNNPFKDKYLPKCEYLPECEYLPKCKYIPRYSHLSKYSSFSKFSTCVTPSIFLPRKISGAVFSGFTLCIFSLALCLFFLPVAAFCAPLLDQSLRQTPVVQAVKATAPAVVNINVAHTQQTIYY